MSAQHTPGPWEIVGTHCPQIVSNDHGSERVIAAIDPVGTPRVLHRDEAAANARLIAAAPNLVETLSHFVKQWEACGPNSDFGRYFAPVYTQARAAIAKATQP